MHANHVHSWLIGGTVLLAACGGNAPPTPDAFVDHSCSSAPDDPIPCTLAPPLPPCSRTFVENGKRGCCVVGQFYECDGGQP